MKMNLVVQSLISCIVFRSAVAYQLIYEKTFGTQSNCFDIPSVWQTIEGGPISSCSTTCFFGSEVIAHIYDQSSTQGLSFTYPISTLSEQFSFVGVDLLYFKTENTTLSLSLNEIQILTIDNSSILSIYEEKKNITCPDTRPIFKANAILGTSSLSNQINFKIIKSSPSQIIGIRGIRLWTNCRKNCKTCLDSLNCNECLEGLSKQQLSSGFTLCEQFTGCTISNCFSCFKDSSIEVCSKCQPGYQFDISNSCILINNSVPPAYTYYSSGTITFYSFGCLYQDKTTLSFVTCINQEDVSHTRYCYNQSIVIVYDQESYGAWNCGCLVQNCKSCTTSALCSECNPGFTLNGNSTACTNTCSPSQFYEGACTNCISNCHICTTATNCNECNLGFSYDQTLHVCAASCPIGQYLSSSICVNCDSSCQNCTSATHCIACAVGYTLNVLNSQCHLNCNSNQYLDNALDYCVNCGTYCSSCTSSQCNVCYSSYFIDQPNIKNCISCSVPNCIQCVTTIISNISYFQSMICGVCDTGFTLTNAFICQSNQLPFSSNSSFPNIEITLSSQEILSEGYKLIIGFSSDTNIEDVSLESFAEVEITNKQDFTIEIQDLTSQYFTVKIISESNIKNQQITITIVDPIFLSQNKLNSVQIQEDLATFVKVDQKQKEISQAVTLTGKSGSLLIISSMASIMILSNFYLLVNTLDITGFFYYMLYINIRLPQNVVQFYQLFKDFQLPFIPNMFDGIINYDYQQQSPPKFMEKGTDLQDFIFKQFNINQSFFSNRYFLKNVGRTFSIWAGVFCTYLLAKILSLMNIPSLSPYLKSAINRRWELGAFFDLIWNTFIYAFIGVLLQFKNYEFVDSNCMLNYTLHSLCSAFILSYPFIVWWLILREKDIKSSLKFRTKYNALIAGLSIGALINEDIETLKDFSTNQNQEIKLNNILTQQSLNMQFPSPQHSLFKNKSLLQQEKINQEKIRTQQNLAQYFYPVLYFRKVIFGLIIVFPTERIYFQLSSVIFLSLVIIYYYLISKPYQSKSENIKIIVGELVIIGICSSAYALIQDEENQDEQTRWNIGWAIICMTASILIWHATQLFIEAIKLIINLFKYCLFFKRKRQVFPEFHNEKQQRSDSLIQDNKGHDGIINNLQEKSLNSNLKDSKTKIVEEETTIDIELNSMQKMNSQNYLFNNSDYKISQFKQILPQAEQRDIYNKPQSIAENELHEKQFPPQQSQIKKQDTLQRRKRKLQSVSHYQGVNLQILNTNNAENQKHSLNQVFNELKIYDI